MRWGILKNNRFITRKDYLLSPKVSTIMVILQFTVDENVFKNDYLILLLQINISNSISPVITVLPLVI